jgi:hypothetical protein
MGVAHYLPQSPLPEMPGRGCQGVAGQPPPCCRSAILWAGSGQFAGSRFQMSSMKIGGTSLTAICSDPEQPRVIAKNTGSAICQSRLPSFVDPGGAWAVKFLRMIREARP